MNSLNEFKQRNDKIRLLICKRIIFIAKQRHWIEVGIKLEMGSNRFWIILARNDKSMIKATAGETTLWLVS